MTSPCPSCAADPTCAPSRYCLAVCLCDHEDCPSYATSPPRPSPYREDT